VKSRERGGRELMPELGYRPVNRYLPPRRKQAVSAPAEETLDTTQLPAALRWLDRILSR